MNEKISNFFVVLRIVKNIEKVAMPISNRIDAFVDNAKIIQQMASEGALIVKKFFAKNYGWHLTDGKMTRASSVHSLDLFSN